MNEPELAQREHEFATQLLPWYANGTLSCEDKLRVEQHLSTCLQCRHELEVVQSLQNTIASVETSIPSSAPALRSVLNRIERDRRARNKVDAHSVVASLATRLRGWLIGSPQIPVAMAVMVVLAVAALLLGRNQAIDPDSSSPYSVLSSDGAGRDVQLSIEFVETLSVAQARLIVEEILSDEAMVYSLTPLGDRAFALDIAESSIDVLAATVKSLRQHSMVRGSEIVQ